MTDKEVEQENIKKRAIVEQALNDCYINDIKRCFSSLSICAVFFTDIPHYCESKKISDLRNRHNVQINGKNSLIYCISYSMCKDNNEKIYVYYATNESERLEYKSFEVGEPTEHLYLLESAVDLLTEFSKNFSPRITYDYIGD